MLLLRRRNTFRRGGIEARWLYFTEALSLAYDNLMIIMISTVAAIANNKYNL